MKKILFISILIIMVSSCQKDNGYIKQPRVKTDHYTAEVMRLMGKVSDPQPSPDGSKILYGVSYTSIEQNRECRQLFVMDADGGNRTQLTKSPSSISNARWIEGGKRIAYLCKGQIYVCNADGKRARQISDIPGGIGEFKLSADEKQVIYTADFKNYTAPTDRYPDLKKATVRTIDNLMYRHWDHFVEYIPHSYVAKFKTKGKIKKGTDILDGAPFELPTEPWSGLEQLSWSPDGKYIAYSCRKLTGKEYAFSTNTDIYLYDVAKKTAENLTEGMPGYDTDPVFSPDGSKIAWLSMERAGYEADRVRLFVMDLASRTRRELTVNFDYNAESPAWNPDGGSIWFASVVEGLGQIWKADLATGALSRVTPENEWYDFHSPIFTVDAFGNPRIITTNTSMLRPAEIVAVNPADGKWAQLTHENDDILTQLEEIKVEDRWLTTTDGGKMLTWVLYPPKFDPKKVYPSILVCLGGPQSCFSQEWSTRWNYRLMASQGYVVVLPNRHGTTGFGQAWCEQISGDYTGQNMQDYFTAADALLAEPYVGKMAAIGASYGGYSVYNLAGIHQKRFSAFIAHCGIFNEEHMFMETEEMWFPNWDNGGIAMPDVPQAGAPWSSNPVARKLYDHSPHTMVKNWDTPIMVIHGEKDFRVPYDQGMAAFNAAQMMGVESKMLLFPDENHWVLKPQNCIYWHREVFDWLDRWCK
ncbi:MAG: S9 family peptidase [Bacteroidales bacterium]|nr:S9 family peptidase [Bacteroidales bacterium]